MSQNLTAASDQVEVTVRPKGNGRRTFALGCGGLAAVVLFSVLGYLQWANHLPPPEVDTRVLPNPNGFDACTTAANKLTSSANSPLGSPNKTDPAVLRPLLEEQRPELDELRQAMRLEYMTAAIRDFNTVYPYLAKYREASRRFLAESRVALADGKPGEAMQRSLDAVELGSLAGQKAPLIHGLVGNACAAIGMSGVEPIIGRLSVAEAAAAGRRLDRIIARFPTAAEMLREERQLGLAGLRQIFKGQIDPALLTGAAANGATPSAGPMGTPFMSVWPKSWSYGTMNAAYQQAIAEAEKPFQQRQPVPLPQEPLTALLLPVLEESHFSFARTETALRLLRFQLALQEYRARQGRYPPGLDGLPAALKPHLADPFGSGPLVYHPQGSGYVLYSVGPDGKDDGGKAIPSRLMKREAKGDMVAGKLYPRMAGDE